jgi:MFS transporter, NNP family, nitrate/nitrite transporter
MAFYGFSFGVELTVDNNLAPYIQSQFNKSLVAAGNFAAIFGLLNFFSRPGGECLHLHSIRLNELLCT